MTGVSSEMLLLIAFGILVVGAILSALSGSDWRRTGYTATAFMAVACVMVWIVAARAFSGEEVRSGQLLVLSPLGASLTLRVDRFSAIFLLLVPFVSLVANLYAVEYMAKVHPNGSPRRYYPFALLLLAAIVGVVTSSDLFFFFVFWELMTLMSWVLVWYDRDNEDKVKAAWQYFVVTHVAAACILVAALVVWSQSGSFAFSNIAAAIGAIGQATPALAHVLMAFFLIGFVTKAGMFPFGGWLPQAYPAAPSPASAAFAGSMTKLGIYGVVRVATALFAEQPSVVTVWGGVIAVMGTLSIFVGTLTALREDDAKRVLSFHIIGQIGYMLLGIGTGLFFLDRSPLLAALALMAGVFHVINHAIYKSLLFLNVGAAEYQTGTRDLNRMGGLITAMPLTAAATIIASLSIAGIPPLSGFGSKWLIYQSTIRGGITTPLFLLLAVVAMFISLVTLTSFMKLVGSIFLGKRPADLERITHEVPVGMRVPQVALSLVCVVLGVAPILPLLAIHAAARDVLGPSVVPGFATLFGSSPFGMALESNGAVVGSWNPATMVALLLACCLGAYGLSRLGRAASRKTESWYGGEEAKPDDVRYRAHGFCLPFKNVFANVYPRLPLPRAGALKYVRSLLDFDKWLYGPAVNTGGRVTDRISRTHSGVPQLYMVWQLVGLVVVLAVALAVLRS